MRKMTYLMAISGLLITGCMSTHGPVGAGVGVGTTGFVAEAKYAPTDHLQMRGSFNVLQYDRTEEIDGIDYDGELNMTNVGVFADYFPFHNGFNISGGAYMGDKSVDLTATPASNVEIGSMSFTPAQVGTLQGDVKMKDFAPYLGVGYDNFIGSSNISFNARAGVMFGGSPEANLNAVGGLLSTDPVLTQELRSEIEDIENDLEDFKYYPVISIGLAKKF